MAKKSGDEKRNSFFSTILESFRRNITGELISNLKENVKERVRKVERKIFRKIASFMFLLCGVFFISLSLVFFISTYLKLGFTWGLFIVGVIFLLISSICRWLSKRD